MHVPPYKNGVNSLFGSFVRQPQPYDLATESIDRRQSICTGAARDDDLPQVPRFDLGPVTSSDQPRR